MAADDGIYREVDQDLAEEKQMNDFRKWLPVFIGLAVIVVGIVGGKQVWESQKQAAAEQNALAFSSSLENEDPAAVMTGLNTVRADAPAGYSALAGFRVAGLEAAEGNTEAAIAALNSIATNESLPQRMRDLARVRAGYLALNDSGEAALRELNGLQEATTPLAIHAKEVAGLAAIEAGNFDQALGYFEAIIGTPSAMPELKARAEDYAALARLGSNGIALEGESLGQSLESLLDVPVAPAGDATAPAPQGEPAVEGGQQGPAAEESPSAPVAEDESVSETDAADSANSDQNDTEQDGTSDD